MTEFWTMERIDRLFKLVGDGWTFSEVAADIGCTRNAAIGKYNRLRVKRGIHVREPRKLLLRVVDGGQASAPAPKPKPKPKPVTLLPVVVLPPLDKRIGIVEVTGCRYSIADDETTVGGKLFCNEPQDGERPYCAYHAAIAYSRPAKPKDRKYRTIPTSLLRAGGY